MSVSVVIVCSGKPDLLGECLAALLEQTRQPDEVILVSSDGDKTRGDRATGWSEQTHPGFALKIETPEDTGIISALNTGRASARSAVVCFTNDHCVVDSVWLEKIGKHFEDPLTAAVGGPVVMPDHGLSRSNMAFRRHLMRDFDYRLVAEGEREEDMCMSLRSIGFRVVSDPGIKVFGRPEALRTPGRDTSPDLVNRAYHDNTYLWLKHATLPRKLGFLINRPQGGGRLSGREMLSALKGILSGVGTYLSFLRTRPKPYRP
jgi:glycosyltransferase involved in cell wall biosynthesis